MSHDLTYLPLSPEELCELLSRGDWPALAARLGYAPCRLTIVPKAFVAWGFPETGCEGLGQVELLSAQPGFRLLVAQADAVPQSARRRIMLAVHRRNPSELIMWWWVSGCDVTVAIVDESDEGRAFVRRMITGRSEPDPVGLLQWLALAVHDLPAPDAAERIFGLRRHINDALRQDGLTREFFRGFTGALNTLKASMQHGPSDAQERHDISLATLLRLVFIYFLQVRGALDGDRRFVIRQLRACRYQDQSFYRQVLCPLFFGALNRPVDERTAEATRLGRLPFLNGGLFEPLPAEARHDLLDWPAEAWQTVVDELFERFHFTVEVSEGGDECRAVDPEMLGKVFEGLMYGDARATSGSFYTPRDVVRAMVEDALLGYLVDQTGASLEQARCVVCVNGDQPAKLPASLARACRAALECVRILDPAVGTGAFLLESLHTLKRCWHNLGFAPPAADAYAWTRELIHAHLFGVDIHHTAVRLCELRLWLAMLPSLPEADPHKMAPLPNLSQRIAVGNSLISPVDLLSLRVDGNGWAPARQSGAQREHTERMDELQRVYLTAHGHEKAGVQSEIDAERAAMFAGLLSSRRDLLERRLVPLRSLGDSRDLFGNPVKLTGAQRALAQRAEREQAALDAALSDLENARAQSVAFCYDTCFGPVLEGGGFDIVITNPPWVRASRIDPGLKDVLRARYTCNDHTLWPGAERLGIEATFGAQVDLAALFVERCLELLRPGGRLCALLPVKLFRSLHGSALRAVLSTHHVVSIEDFSDAQRQMFDATTYPAVLQVQKAMSAAPTGEQADSPIAISVWRGPKPSRWHSSPVHLRALGEHPAEPWMFVEPHIRRIFDKMRAHTSPLGANTRLQPHRGVLTGCNDVFLVSNDEARALLADDFETWSRPALCGREIRADLLEPTRRILWPYDEQLTLRLDLPARLAAYFEGHSERLRRRADHSGEAPIWQLFRIHQALGRPRVVWRDFSCQLEAAVAPAACIPLNTVYFIACEADADARRLALVLNSEPMRAIAFAIAERARGGWRRHFAWVMRMLPIPDALFAAQAAAGPLDAHQVTRWFGLDESDVQILRAWRLAQLAPSGGWSRQAEVA
ncbi:MAG: hypothetical protein H0U74_10370 [Bradymonadaceae bacterium]|nr:hypothetical protein [Lujinxingiaceae bacterium]